MNIFKAIFLGKDEQAWADDNGNVEVRKQAPRGKTAKCGPEHSKFRAKKEEEKTGRIFR